MASMMASAHRELQVTTQSADIELVNKRLKADSSLVATIVGMLDKHDAAEAAVAEKGFHWNSKV